MLKAKRVRAFIKRLGRIEFIRETVALALVLYLRLVQRTSRFVVEPPDFPSRIVPQLPLIGAMWHGQHLIAHYAWPEGASVAALISRHGDAEINANVLRRLGVTAIRGSGSKPESVRRKGGITALREMLRALAQGTTVMLTADVPKVPRIAGLGIVTLAQLSGRPVYPLAVVTSRRLDLKTWDHASFPLPFGRCAMVLGAPIFVARHASPEDLEAARRAVEQGLDAAHDRAYALVGSKDPGRSVLRTAAQTLPAKASQKAAGGSH